jgi:hypothetical protein
MVNGSVVMLPVARSMLTKIVSYVRRRWHC